MYFFEFVDDEFCGCMNGLDVFGEVVGFFVFELVVGIECVVVVVD